MKMAPKRKFLALEEPTNGQSGCKKSRLGQNEDRVKHALLQQHYDDVKTLREFLLSKLPGSSRLRRKKIASLGKDETWARSQDREILPQLSSLLDTTLVCTQHRPGAQTDSRWEQWRTFSQKADDSVVSLSGGLAKATSSQSEIVDFVVWQIFSRIQPHTAWPKHLLCDGFRRRGQNIANVNGHSHDSAIPGLAVIHQNHYVQALKEAPWPQVLMLLGKSGEQVMIDLLIDTAIFLPVKAGLGNMYQLSGIPMSDTSVSVVADQDKTKQTKGNAAMSTAPQERLPSEINFVRNRMLYARAPLTAGGTVQYGLRHIHVLSRCPRIYCPEQAADEEKSRTMQTNERNTLKVMMYIFPRQFRLHNVFTSKVDHSKTSQKFADYTLREDEISATFKGRNIKLPKRLRADTKRLVQRLQLLHGRCAYAELLRHYCPSAIDLKARKPVSKKPVKQSKRLCPSQAPGRDNNQPVTSYGLPSSSTQSRHRLHKPTASPLITKFDAVTDLATPAAHVSAFCQAVLAKLIPDEMWGTGEDRIHNKSQILRKVDHFVKLRRFEAMSLSELADGLRTTSMEWLAPPALKGQKASLTDTKKRLEIMNEFLYYLFDSLLIPLLRSNFYITESSSHRYRLFFFRHDVWRYVAEPAMATLRTNMFEEMKLDEATRVLDSRRLGFSRIRLLPKGKGMRPITNLRRRTEIRGRSTILGPSINSVLGPVHSMLKLETQSNPSKLGSSMFSVGDLYHRLNTFSAGFGNQRPKFYFAKVDVQSAFDTIPQEAVIRLMDSIPSRDQYIIKKHVEVKAGLLDSRQNKNAASKVTRRWHSIAVTRDDTADFSQLVEKRLGLNRKNTVFVGNMMRREVETGGLMALMESHIKQNLVKVGKKFYRQKKGIPQGSVLSSALCNYFYADLEAQHLAFLAGEEEDCLLLRLIDDFLLITTDQTKACRFVQVMHGGLPEYGVTVSPNKTLVNFEMEIDGMSVARLPDGARFPYCGLAVDCDTLDIVKDRGHIKDTVVSNALTVDYGNKPGQNFQRRVLNAFKIQSHLMFYDTKHNTLKTVMTNLHKAFAETSEKMWAYWRCLPTSKRPGDGLVMQTLNKMIDVAFGLLTSKSRREKYPDYAFAIEKTHVAWLALDAVRMVLARKQANFMTVLSWIDAELGRLDSKKAARAKKYIGQWTN
ncbi:telomerase reverse transcriptase [Colletotrichum orchidophilum]|uniref:Telomerase reverse transcriptase n=1 Tax=Colletotrichum orchidophilum TaxID=1209926 RepID=A0A1G4B8V6_9PEZI|nr:telomerase reverse transcriptase [Colletotrichum orchidophilum]OHE97841.1 telomerase reverse transcriptase [Colletotrichum orchidophilum]